jgi:hypothetical protein
VTAQGWYRDPFGVHEDRYFSAGVPTKLVRDTGAECYDPPPPGPPEAELVEVTRIQPNDGSDLRRSDNSSAGAVNDYQATAWGAIDSALVYAPRN